VGVADPDRNASSLGVIMTYALSQAFNPNPPPAKPPNVGMMLAWGALVAMTGGIFYYTVKTPKAVTRNRRRSSRRSSSPTANPKLVGNSLSQSLIRSRIKSSAATLSRAGAPKAVLNSAKGLPEGVYRLSGRGDVIVHRDASVTPSLIRSTRIAASKSPSSQMWLVQVVRSSSGRRRAVPVRGYKRVGGRTETVFRIEAT
jgi:hypothetical protein